MPMAISASHRAGRWPPERAAGAGSDAGSGAGAGGRVGSAHFFSRERVQAEHGQEGPAIICIIGMRSDRPRGDRALTSVLRLLDRARLSELALLVDEGDVPFGGHIAP